MNQTMSIAEFNAKYKRTGVTRSAIFSERKPLMEELYATGVPIWCDQTYYAYATNLDLVKKVDDHFECAGYTEFEFWRDCHYYNEYQDENGNKAWVMTGGRYD